jgi:hypothetical protein
MNWYSLERVWRMSGRRNNLKVRFSDWPASIRYFLIQAESSDGKRFVGELDSGEKMSFSKRSRGWELYYQGSEQGAHAV